MIYIANDIKLLKSITDEMDFVTSLKEKTVLITGGTGMICSGVVEILLYLNKYRNTNISIILAARSKERVAATFPEFLEGIDYTYLYYDAVQENSLNVAADYIIHGASNANPAAYVREPVETMLANIIGLNELLKCAVANATKRVLYLSSSEVYGQKESMDPYQENDYGFVDILSSRAAYPSAKRAAESLCISYFNEHSLDVVIVRPGHIYGPSITTSDTRASAEFSRDVAAGRNIIMKSAGTQLRSYCYYLDCASAILYALLYGESANAYNISNKDSIVTISELAQTLAKHGNVKVVVKDATSEEKKGFNLMSNSSLDASLLEKLGWRAMVDINTGAKYTISQLKEYSN